MCPNGDNVCTQLCGRTEGQSPAAEIEEEHRDSFPDEDMLELGLERWIRIGRCPGGGQGKERRAFPEEFIAGVKVQVCLKARHFPGTTAQYFQWLEHEGVGASGWGTGWGSADVER